MFGKSARAVNGWVSKERCGADMMRVVEDWVGRKSLCRRWIRRTQLNEALVDGEKEVDGRLASYHGPFAMETAAKVS